MRAIRRAGRKATATERLRRLDRCAGPAALVRAAGDPSIDIARRALGWLADDAGPAERDDLRELLWTCDPALVMDVARTLRTLGDQQTVTVAANRLRAGLTAERCRAARVLERFADRRAIPALCDALSDADASVRGATLDALARVARDDVAAHAAALLVADPNAEVRRRAVHAVGCLSADPAVAVRPAIGDPVPAVRREAGRLAARLAAPDVARLFADHDPEVRCATAASASRGTEAMLASALRSDAHPRVRAQAAHTLAVLGGDVAAAALLGAILHDRDAVVRARSLRMASDTLSEPVLVACLHHELMSADASSRQMALRALARLSAQLSGAETVAIARDPDPDVRLALTQLAGVLVQRPKGVYVLLAGDVDPTVRHAAALHL